MKISTLCFAFAALLLGTCSADSRTRPRSGLIRPGEGIPGVQLGSHFSSFEAVFPKHPGLDEDLPDTLCGAGRVYHWLDIEKHANGVYAFLKNDEIYQLSVQTPRFALPNGLTIDASEKKVKAAYPNGRGHVLLGSGAAYVGGRDLVYWVDKKKGIAFELYWDGEKKQRLVRAIDIFRKGGLYFPQGCVTPPQEWRELGLLF
jgi:hypothetical protein